MAQLWPDALFLLTSPQIRNEEGNRLLRKSATAARPVSSRRLPLWEKCEFERFLGHEPGYNRRTT